MNTDLFFTPAWFDLLRSRGLEKPPHAQRSLVLPGVPGSDTPALQVMQATRGGAWASLANYYSGLYGPSGDVSHVSMDDWALAAQRVRRWEGGGLLCLEPLDAQSAWLPALEQGWRRAGYRVWKEPAFGNWYQPVETGDFENYWQARPSALRNTIQRARRRLDRAGDWCVEIFAPVAGVSVNGGPIPQRLKEAFLQVYAKSWKPQEPNGLFIPALMDLAAAQGCLRLGVVWLLGEPIATQLWLVYPGRSAQIFKLAHVKGQEKWSAGSVLTADLARRSIEVDAVQELDFLSGDDAYKADWMGFRRVRERLVMAHPGSRMGLAALGRRLVRSAMARK